MGYNYQRLFYIFQSMDNTGNPTGYLKVEINGLTAKLHVSISNITNRPGLKYRLYGICKNESLVYTDICDIQESNGRADLKLSVDTGSVGSSSLELEAINVFAVIAQMSDRNNIVYCPLVAYKNGEVQWKQDFEASLRNTALQQSSRIPSVIEKVYKQDSDLSIQSVNIDDTEAKEEKFRTISEINRELEKQDEQNNTVDGFSNTYVAQDDRTNTIYASDSDQQSLISLEEMERDDLDEDTVGNLSDLIDVTVNMTNEASARTEDDTYESTQPSVTDGTTNINFDNVQTPQSETGQNMNLNKGRDTDNLIDIANNDVTSKFEATINSIYTKENADNSEIDNDIISAAERNLRDISSINEGNNVRSEFNINLLREELDKSFEICNPFNTRSKRFKWWKINSPGYLNNILFRNDVKTYLLFNPKVMFAHYKYRYIIFGIRYDKFSGRERLVCGVPGVYSIDDNPFGNLGSWAQLEGYKPKYGAFGYWIILIDPRTGKLLKLSR